MKKLTIALAMAIILALLTASTAPLMADGSWHTETVDSGGHKYSSTSLALDSSGNPRISYSSDSGLKYASWNGTSWNIATVDNVSGDTSLALDSAGNPHISYYDSTDTGDHKYASWNGTSWDITTVDSAGTVGYADSLALDSSGRPRISYFDSTNYYLKYAYLSKPPPTASSISPKTGVAGWSVSVTNLAGTGFQAGASVRLEGGSIVVNATNVSVVSDTKITCKLALPGTLGKYDVVVKNPDGQEGRLVKGFSVTNICGQGTGTIVVGFGLMMGLLSLGGSGLLRRRRGRRSSAR